QRRLSSCRPGTIASPDSPPFVISRTRRRSSFAFGLSSSPWHWKQCAFRIGRTCCSYVRTAARPPPSAPRTVENGQSQTPTRKARRQRCEASFMDGGPRRFATFPWHIVWRERGDATCFTIVEQSHPDKSFDPCDGRSRGGGSVLARRILV